MSGHDDGFSALEQLQAKAMTYLEAENQRLRAALEMILDVPFSVERSAYAVAHDIARAALDGTQ